MQKLAIVGDPAPDGSTHASLLDPSDPGQPNRPAFADFDQAAFVARTAAGLGLFAVTVGGGARTIAMKGDALPGGETIYGFAAGAMGGDVAINGAGEVLYEEVAGQATELRLWRAGVVESLLATGGATPAGAVASFASSALGESSGVAIQAWIDDRQGERAALLLSSP